MKVSLVTTDPEIVNGRDVDLAPVTHALEHLGITVIHSIWHDHAVDWSQFDALLIRSPWDYSRKPTEFRTWLHGVSKIRPVLNCQHTIDWNLDKRYLLDLQAAGVPIVPTRFASSMEQVTQAIDEFAASAPEIVVKPSVSAGARDTGRFAHGDDAARQLANRVIRSGRTAMIQPAVPSVASQGESALIYFDGAFSHAVTKGPILELGGGYVSGRYTEQITAHTPNGEQHHLADAAALAIPGIVSAMGCHCPTGPPLYSRFDIVSTNSGYALLEAELFEPSYFVDTSEGAAQRFALAASTRIHQLTDR